MFVILGSEYIEKWDCYFRRNISRSTIPFHLTHDHWVQGHAYLCCPFPQKALTYWCQHFCLFLHKHNHTVVPNAIFPVGELFTAASGKLFPVWSERRRHGSGVHPFRAALLQRRDWTHHSTSTADWGTPPRPNRRARTARTSTEAATRSFLIAVTLSVTFTSARIIDWVAVISMGSTQEYRVVHDVQWVY